MTRRRSRGAGSCLKSTDVRFALALVVAVAAAAARLAAQPPPSVALHAEPSSESAALVFYNRPIVTFRATVLGRPPRDRVDTALRTLEDLALHHITGPIVVNRSEGGVIVLVAQRGVVALTTPDIDVVAGETLDSAGAQVAERLRQALGEAAEARRFGALLRALLLALLGLSVGFTILWGLFRLRRVVADRLLAISERRLVGSGLAAPELLRSSRLLDFERGLVTFVFAVAGLIVTYISVTFAMRQLPYTRPWGESMSALLLSSAEALGTDALNAIPGLFTVFLIALVTRFLVRLVRLWFDAVETGRVRPRWIHPDTAQPTRRLATALLWLFALVMAYPYLPGSNSEAFKGMSVFLGVLVTLGSSGLVTQMMSGLMITYSRALRVGDFVKIGDVEGTVLSVGVLSTKVRTLRFEEVTIPNAVVIATTTTDYSRPVDASSVMVPTSVTIGYDTPWRQVHSLLLLAAERTPGLCRDPQPVVLQAALQDFYVNYTLYVSLDRQDSRLFTMGALHANIQDLFNEYGVQIMSPNYMLDPAGKKVVPRKDWFAAPAQPDQ